MEYAITKVHSNVETPVNEIERYRFKINDGSLFDSSNCRIGYEATVVAGRKIPKGTRVIVRRYMESKYGQSFKSAWDGKLYNPVVLVELPDGSTTWTQGQNLKLDPENVIGYVATIEAEDENQAKLKMENTYKDLDGDVFYIDRDGKPVHKLFNLSDHGLSFYHDNGVKYLADCGETWACVLDDWRSDIYSFRVFTKVPALNNTLEIVDTGTDRRHTDMVFDGCTGIENAIKAYNEYVAAHKAA